MTDFLSNLAARSFETPGGVRPRLPHRFEQAALPLDNAVLPLRDETFERTAAAAVPTTRPTPRPPSASAPEPPARAHRSAPPVADASPRRATQPAIQPQPPAPPSAVPRAAADPAPPVLPRVEPVERVIRERIVQVVEEAGGVLAEAQAPAPPGPPADTSQMRPAPPPEPAQAVPPAVVPQPPEPPHAAPRIERRPSVRVTIGRVEVQAAPPSAPPPLPTPRPARPRYRPAMTLSDYLEQRNGGKR